MFQVLKEDKNQRLVYGFGLLLWIILWFNDFKYINKETLGIYSLQVIIPSLILIWQLIFINEKIWILLIVYSGLYSLWVLWNIIYLDFLIDFHRDFTPQPFWTFEKLKDLTVMLLILFLVNWTIWKIKPKKA